MASLFGFEIRRKKDRDEAKAVSFTPPVHDDGAVEISSGGAYGTYVDLDGSIKTESELVTRYRQMAEHADIDRAVDDIVNESIVTGPDEDTVSVVLDDIEFSDSIKNTIQDEFKTILELLKFNTQPYDIFRKWYIDGRLYYHVVLDENNPKAGIQELRYIDPRKIRKIREKKRKNMEGKQQFTVSTTGKEYYIFNEKGFTDKGSSSYGGSGTNGLKIAKDSIVHTTSGLLSTKGDLVLSYLHKAIKPLNQLRALEDSMVIYRISRAPERRIFYIDVGNLPKMKAEEYLRDIMTKFKNKLVYDASTGEVRDDRKFMTMLEDFWLPRREGGRGTEITTLPGGQNLGETNDVEYFQRKLYNSLIVPMSRLDPTTVYNVGRTAEITRDEIKFSKFVDRLRSRFSNLFLNLLERQLILKNVLTSEDWLKVSQAITFDYARDNYFEELKQAEVMRDRVQTLRDMDDFTGKYFSHKYIRKNVLHQNEEEMEAIDKDIEDEQSREQYTGMPAEKPQGQEQEPEEQPTDDN